MKFKCTFFLLLLSLSTSSFSKLVWTDGDAWGTGKEISLVYPQYAQKRLIFKTTEGKYYAFNWGDSVDMTERAKTFMSMLLVAITSKKKVSFTYDDEIVNYSPISLMMIHD